MSEGTSVVVVGSKVPEVWGEVGQVRALARRLGETLYKNKNFTGAQLMHMANYCIVSRLNPWRGEVYFYINKGQLCVVDGYKALNRWADRQAPFDTWDEDIPLVEGEVEHVCVWIFRHDRIPLVNYYIDVRGMDPEEAHRAACKYACGVVLDYETRTNSGGVNYPPVGWTWRDVARKRALKNALNLSHGAPSIDELAAQSWEVNGVETIDGDWRRIPDHMLGRHDLAEKYAAMEATERQAQAERAKKTPEERQESAARNSRAIFGPDPEEPSPYDDPPPEYDEEPEPPPSPPPAQPTGKKARIETADWGPAARELVVITGYYKKSDGMPNWDHLRATAGMYGFAAITDENLNTVIDVLRSHAEEKRKKAAEAAEAQPELPGVEG